MVRCFGKYTFCQAGYIAAADDNFNSAWILEGGGNGSIQGEGLSLLTVPPLINIYTALMYTE